MKKLLTIIGLVALVGVSLGGSALAYNTYVNIDYDATITASLKRANEEKKVANNLSCEYIGKLTSDCYARKPGACATLKEKENEFINNFDTDSYNDCFRDENTAETSSSSVASETSSVAQNPLFFDDAE